MNLLTKSLLAITLVLAQAGAAGAVEKTAIDKRLNSPMDVDVQALQTFIGSLTGQIQRDLGTQIRYLESNVTMINNLVPLIQQRIDRLTVNYDACPHALVDVPTVSTYDPTRQRMTWQPGSNAWAPQNLQSWEHN
jgi:hypothetical protein